MPKSIPRLNSGVMTRQQSNVSMMSSSPRKACGTNLEPIAETGDYFSGAFGAGEMASKFGGKVRRGGVGAKAGKTRNYKVSEKANKRRAEKYDRDLRRE